MARRATTTAHPLELPRPLAALGILGLWAVGIALIDPRAILGVAVCLLAVTWTVWLYSSDLRAMRLRSIRKWPWIGLIFITLEIAVPAYLVWTKFIEPAYPATAGVTTAPTVTPAPPPPAPPTASAKGDSVCPGNDLICLNATNGGTIRNIELHTEICGDDDHGVLGINSAQGSVSDVKLDHVRRDRNCERVPDAKSRPAQPAPPQSPSATPEKK